MNAGALRALEFDRIVSVLSGLAVTPAGYQRLAELRPSTTVEEVASAQRATTEGARFLAEHRGFPLHAPADLDALLGVVNLEGRALEPLGLLALADCLESIQESRNAILKLGASFPILRGLVEGVASFQREIADLRQKVDVSGAVKDNASPALGDLRERLRKQRARLRSVLESFLRGRDTVKYLQDQVITDRNGRYVLIVRTEHRSAIPGIVHGASASGASLFLEPIGTVEINNDIVALEEQEAEEIRRILLALTDAFRDRTVDLHRTIDVATELDLVQARGQFSHMVGGVEPAIAVDGTLDLRGARHPLLMQAVREKGEKDTGCDFSQTVNDEKSHPVSSPVPIDIRLLPPLRILIITGPNTGGKTVALKTAGLFAAMAQAGLHIPAEKGSRLPVFRSVFADIGDEQSISNSLSTFSGHIANVVSMDTDLALPALVLLDEVGAGTDPVEGGALGIAIIDHFRRRGAHLMATTHYDALKSYASTTEGVAGAAFGFDPDTFAPTYRLVYGSPGRSLAIEIGARLGLPKSVIEAARKNMSEREQQLTEHLARIDDELRALEHERTRVARERTTVAETEKRIRTREDAVAQREEKVRRKLDTKLDEQVRDARREIDAVIEGLKARATQLSDRGAVRLNAGGKVRAAGVSTGDLGAARTDARAALDGIAQRLTDGGAPAPPPLPASPQPDGPIEVGSRVSVGTFGLEGVVVELHGKHAEIDVRGKRLRAALRDLRSMAGHAAVPTVKVNVDLQPRTGGLGELNVIGATVDQAMDLLDKFFDQATVSDAHEVRIIHGHGTGQLRRAVARYLKEHPLIERFETAPENQGGGGATIAYLKD